MMTKFVEFLGPKPNWDPIRITGKFKFKKSERWNLQQKIVKQVLTFEDDPLMVSTLRQEFTFLALVKTENLEALDPDQSYDLINFLDHYEDPWIWVLARGLTVKKKTPFSRSTLDENHFEIRDIDFSKKNRDGQINCRCRYDDLMMAITFEPDEKVAIIVSATYFTTVRSKQQGRQCWINVKPTKEYRSFFQVNKDDEDDEDKNTPGTSGISRSQSQSSEVRSDSEFDSQRKGRQKEKSQSRERGTEKSQSRERKTESSQSKEGESESEVDKQKSKAGRKRKRTCPSVNVKFGKDLITVETEERTHKFVIEPISNKPSYRGKHWVGRTKEERQKQWKELFDKPFDLFERVRNDEAEGLRFFRYKDLFPKESQKAVEKEWGALFPNTPFPRETLLYIIFDSSQTNPYLG